MQISYYEEEPVDAFALNFIQIFTTAGDLRNKLYSVYFNFMSHSLLGILNFRVFLVVIKWWGFVNLLGLLYVFNFGGIGL